MDFRTSRKRVGEDKQLSINQTTILKEKFG